MRSTGLIVPMPIAVGHGVRQGGQIPIGLKQPDTEDQRQRNAAPRGVDDPRPFRDIADLILDRAHPIGADEIAFIEQDDVGVDQLIACGSAREKIEAEVFGVGDADDRVDAHQVAKFRPQKGQNDRQRVGNPAALDAR